MSKILVIEDNIDVLENIVTLLNEEGYNVIFSTDGQSGYDKIKKDKPDLVICDILLPGLSGYQIRENLNKEGIFDVPFIFLTALSEYEDYRKGMCLGADDFLLKPFKASDLLESISIRLKKYYGKIAGKVIVSKGNKKIPIEQSSIMLIESENQYSKLTTINEENFIVRKSLKEWTEELPENIFLRVSRFSIINKNFIDVIVKEENKNFIKLKNIDKEISISKSFYPKLKREIL